MTMTTMSRMTPPPATHVTTMMRRVDRERPVLEVGAAVRGGEERGGGGKGGRGGSMLRETQSTLTHAQK